MHKRHRFIIGGFAGVCAFIVATLISIHLRSDAGLWEGLGVVNNAQDDIRRIGFPFQFFEAGGLAYRCEFSVVAFIVDFGVMVACFAVFGITCTLLQRSPQMS